MGLLTLGTPRRCHFKRVSLNKFIISLSFFLMFFPSVNLETPRPSIHLTVPQTYINYEHLSSPHQGTFDVSMSSYPETGENQFSIRTFQDDWSVLSPGRMETSHHHHHPRHHSTNTSLSESLTGGDIIQDETNTVTIKFSSRSKNSQSFDNNPTPTTSGERSGEWKKKRSFYQGIVISFFLFTYLNSQLIQVR